MIETIRSCWNAEIRSFLYYSNQNSADRGNNKPEDRDETMKSKVSSTNTSTFSHPYCHRALKYYVLKCNWWLTQPRTHRPALNSEILKVRWNPNPPPHQLVPYRFHFSTINRCFQASVRWYNPNILSIDADLNKSIEQEDAPTPFHSSRSVMPGREITLWMKEMEEKMQWTRMP